VRAKLLSPSIQTKCGHLELKLVSPPSPIEKEREERSIFLFLDANEVGEDWRTGELENWRTGGLED